MAIITLFYGTQWKKGEGTNETVKRKRDRKGEKLAKQATACLWEYQLLGPFISNWKDDFEHRAAYLHM